LAANATKVTCIYRPYHGSYFAIVFHVPGEVLDANDAGVQAIVGFINACTRAVCIEIILSVAHTNTASATAGVAYTSGDKFLLITRDVNDKAHNFKIPGLKASIVGSNKETVDITVTPASTWAAQVLAHALTPGGEAITAAISGRRSENRKPIKGPGVIIVD
jgi:hypothetical protein